MKVHFLTYYYPPDSAVGALRAGNVAAAFRRRGHHVEVVAAEAGPRGSAQPHEQFATRVRPLPSARDMYLTCKSIARRLLRRQRTAADIAIADGFIPPKHNSKLKRYVVSLLVIPDSQRGFVIPAILRSLRLSVSTADLIYTSGPPHSVHLAGLTLKLLTGARWAAEFRDPWTDNPQKSANVRSPLADSIVRRLERVCLKHADHIVVVSAHARDRFVAKVERATSGRIVLARNGVPPIIPAETLHTAGPEFRIVYLGTLGVSRDPRPFLDALAALRLRGAKGADNVRVDFYGNCKFYYDVPVAQYAAQRGLSEVVRVHEPVPHERCASILARADLLLLLAQRQPLQVPNKLYEYLAAGRPILAFADEQGETVDVLAQLGAAHHLVISDVPEHVQTVLARALRDGPGRTISYSDSALRELSTESQLDRLVTALDDSNARSRVGRRTARPAAPDYDACASDPAAPASLNDHAVER